MKRLIFLFSILLISVSCTKDVKKTSVIKEGDNYKINDSLIFDNTNRRIDASRCISSGFSNSQM